jgi:hypothetical protein
LDSVAADFAGEPAEDVAEADFEADAEAEPLGLAFFGFFGFFDAEGEADVDAGADAAPASSARTWSAPDDPGLSWCPHAAVAASRSTAPAVKIPVRERETGSTKRPFEWAGVRRRPVYIGAPHAPATRKTFRAHPSESTQLTHRRLHGFRGDQRR